MADNLALVYVATGRPVDRTRIAQTLDALGVAALLGALRRVVGAGLAGVVATGALALALLRAVPARAVLATGATAAVPAS